MTEKIENVECVDPDVSLVIPVLDEQRNLAPLMSEIAGAMRANSLAFEVIFVDDGSRDDSSAELEMLRVNQPSVRVLRHTVTYGQSAAHATGFQAARGRIIVTMDADGQHDPADLPRLVDALKGDVACACGVRTSRCDAFVKRASSAIANRFRDIVTGDHLRDAGCSYRAIRRDALTELPVWNGMHRFLPTLLRAQGFRVEELPVGHRPRMSGVSKYGVANRLWCGIRDCFAVRWYRARAVPFVRVAQD